MNSTARGRNHPLRGRHLRAWARQNALFRDLSLSQPSEQAAFIAGIEQAIEEAPELNKPVPEKQQEYRNHKESPGAVLHSAFDGPARKTAVQVAECLFLDRVKFTDSATRH